MVGFSLQKDAGSEVLRQCDGPFSLGIAVGFDDNCPELIDSQQDQDIS